MGSREVKKTLLNTPCCVATYLQKLSLSSHYCTDSPTVKPPMYRHYHCVDTYVQKLSLWRHYCTDSLCRDNFPVEQLLCRQFSVKPLPWRQSYLKTVSVEPLQCRYSLSSLFLDSQCRVNTLQTITHNTIAKRHPPGHVKEQGQGNQCQTPWLKFYK